VNANDWDLTLFSTTRATSHANVPRIASRWDRESLYQHFDPYARAPIPTPTKSRTASSPAVHHLRSASSALIEINGENSLRDDFFLTDHDLRSGGVESEDVFSFPISPPVENEDLGLEPTSSAIEIEDNWKMQNGSPDIRASGLIEIEDDAGTGFFDTAQTQSPEIRSSGLVEIDYDNNHVGNNLLNVTHDILTVDDDDEDVVVVDRGSDTM